MLRLRWLTLLGLLYASPASAQRGVPISGFPNWQERTVLVYSNRARADPQADLAGCAVCAEKACYSPVPPFAWDYNLNRAIRFHVTSVKLSAKFDHDSPCTLVSNVSSVYVPNGTCQAEASCSCVGGSFSCNPTCTGWWGRIGSFGTAPYAENLAAGQTTPRDAHYAWLWETDSSSACGWRGSNGHRHSILNGTIRSMGAGFEPPYTWGQDLSRSGSASGTLISGSHEPQFSSTSAVNFAFRVNYYDTRGGPQSGQLNLDGTCTAMTLERGSQTNGTWLAEQSLTGTSCMRYQFIFKDPAGATVLLPETGSYSIGGSSAGCGDWSATVPPGCGGSNQPPTVATPASASPNPVTASSTALSVLGADDTGEVGLSYTWAATSGPAVVAFSPNGANAAKSSTATFTRAGSYVLQVTVRDPGGLTAISSVSLSVSQTLTTVVVSPTSASVSPGGTQQFAASGSDQFGATLAPQPSFSWTVGGGGSINASGLFTAGSAPGGPYTVTASASGKGGTASVSVSSGTPPSVATPASASPNPVTATSTALTVLGADDGGEAALTYTWAAISGPAAVSFSPNGTNAAKSSTATFTRAGSYSLEVTLRDVLGLTAKSSVAVTVSATPSSLTVSPPSVSVQVGTTRQFTAELRDQFGAALAPQPSFSWTVSGGGSIDASGLFTAGSTPGGPYTVTASASGKGGTASISVSSGTPPSVATPASASPNPVPATSTALTVLGADDGGEAALTYTWAANSGPAVVSFSPNGTNSAKSSTATFTRAGSYSLEATLRDALGLTAKSSVAVTVSATPSSLTVSPPSVSVQVGTTRQFTAELRDQFGATLVAPQLNWSVSGGGGIDFSGLFAAGASPGGPFTVAAQVGGVAGTALVTVVPGGVDTTPPTVVVTVPSEGARLRGSSVFEASASDDVGVVRLSFLVDGSEIGQLSAAPWRLGVDTSTMPDGAHQLSARAWDAAGNPGASATVAFLVENTVADTIPPQVRVLTPAAGARLGGPLVLTAEASDEVGVARVVWELDGEPVGEAVQAPWERRLGPGEVAPGAHSTVAVAYDAAGNAGRSARISFEMVDASKVVGTTFGCNCAAADGGALAVCLAILMRVLRRRARR